MCFASTHNNKTVQSIEKISSALCQYSFQSSVGVYAWSWTRLEYAPVRVGLEIMDKLRGHTSGLAIPYYVIDAPGGGGKIPLLPQYVLGRNGKDIILRNYKYEIYTYPDVEEAPVEQHPVEHKYLRKRQNGRRKPVTVPDTLEGTEEKIPVQQDSVEHMGK